jgi:hypothetical protein
VKDLCIRETFPSNCQGECCVSKASSDKPSIVCASKVLQSPGACPIQHLSAPLPLMIHTDMGACEHHRRCLVVKGSVASQRLL